MCWSHFFFFQAKISAFGQEEQAVNLENQKLAPFCCLSPITNATTCYSIVCNKLGSWVFHAIFGHWFFLFFAKPFFQAFQQNISKNPHWVNLWNCFQNLFNLGCISIPHVCTSIAYFMCSRANWPWLEASITFKIIMRRRKTMTSRHHLTRQIHHYELLDIWNFMHACLGWEVVSSFGPPNRWTNMYCNFKLY